MGVLAMAMAMAMAMQAGAVLVLDATDGAVACPKDPGSDVVVCAGDQLRTRMPIRVAGTTGVVLVEPSGPRDLLCNPDFIVRAGVMGRGPFKIANIGPVDVEAATGSANVSVAGKTRIADIRWTARRSVRDADCVAGPEAIGHRVVRFRLGPSKPGMTTATLKFDGSRDDRAYAVVPVGKREIFARFEIDQATNVLTAPGAHVVAGAVGGTVTGPPRAEHIMYGIERSIRRMETRRPLAVGNLALAELWVRVADYGQANGIRSLADDEVGEGDVLVAAKRRTPGRNRLLRVGRDAVAGCASITVDTRRREFTIVC